MNLVSGISDRHTASTYPHIPFFLLSSPLLLSLSLSPIRFKVSRVSRLSYDTRLLLGTTCSIEKDQVFETSPVHELRERVTCRLSSLHRIRRWRWREKPSSLACSWYMHIGERLKIEREEEGERERERESGEELSDGFDGTRGRSPFFVTSSRLVHAGKSDFCQLESYRSSWILYKRRDYFRDEGRVLELSNGNFLRFIFWRRGAKGLSLSICFLPLLFLFSFRACRCLWNFSKTVAILSEILGNLILL